MSDAPAEGDAQETATRQPRNPLHGMTLEAIVTELVDHFGWAGLGERIQVNSFNHEPSIRSSLKFLRKTPWAREKVESLYLFMRREQARGATGLSNVRLGLRRDDRVGAWGGTALRHGAKTGGRGSGASKGGRGSGASKGGRGQAAARR